MGIACDVVTCKNNLGEFCNKVDIYISEAEMGEPLCQDAEFENAENQETMENKYMVIGTFRQCRKDCEGEALSDLTYDEAMKVKAEWRKRKRYKDVICIKQN